MRKPGQASKVNPGGTQAPAGAENNQICLIRRRGVVSAAGASSTTDETVDDNRARLIRGF
jgi:hypothetical protein